MRGTSQRVGAECTFLRFFALSQGGVPECRCVEFLSEPAPSVRSFAISHLLREVSLSVGSQRVGAECTLLPFFAPSQGGVSGCMDLLSELVLSVRSFAFSHLLRGVSLSVGA